MYVKFANQAGAEAAHRTLNLRWYSGKQVRGSCPAGRDASSSISLQKLLVWILQKDLSNSALTPCAVCDCLVKGLLLCSVLLVLLALLTHALGSSLPASLAAQIIVEYQFVQVYNSVFGLR